MEQDSKVCRGSPGERTCTEHPCKSGVWMRRTEVCGAVAVCVALCLLSLGVCVLVYLRTTELQARVNSLEKHGEPQHSAWMFLEQVEPVLLNRLDQMLEEKLASRLPKTRETRDVSHACLCPPGPPVSTIDLLPLLPGLR
ncbi:collagen alpha-1(XIII) chain [Ictalurus punctatus]|uniref:Collagen alpha-1(XIII) chain n=1 Tax=Ictalurus punctatus TaxID=7998 RepID=A0A9F7TJL8_ICTPU|nr:collagen alpha-1(XIII) chain [Ictalurus punctatus]